MKIEEINVYYKDVEALEERFCKINDCTACNGSDPNGEPNGYGCDTRDKWVESEMFTLVEEQKEECFYSKTEADKVIDSMHELLLEMSETVIELTDNALEEMGVNKDYVLKNSPDDSPYKKAKQYLEDHKE